MKIFMEQLRLCSPVIYHFFMRELIVWFSMKVNYIGLNPVLLCFGGLLMVDSTLSLVVASGEASCSGIEIKLLELCICCSSCWLIVENLLFSVEIDEAIVFRTETLLACLLLMEVAFYSCLCDVNSILPSTPSTVYLQDIDEYS
jgi:hypothetical protein